MRAISPNVLLLVLCLGASAFSAEDPDKDSKIADLLQTARRFIDDRKPAEAVQECDKVIAAYKAHYATSKKRVYCAGSSAESLGYLLKATNDNASAVVLSPTWATAYFMKGYALQDLKRLSEAKTNVQQALALSPFNSQYLSELGNIYQIEKDWTKAELQFKEAEDNAALMPEAEKATELARARRGQAYVLVELGKLDEAEKKYRQCLETDPNDKRAQQELKYIQGLREKKKKSRL
jgi:Flp pilus assembly protein TadD